MHLKWPDWMKSLFGAKTTDADHLDNVEQVAHRLDIFMTTRKPFLQPRYTISQLSEEIGIPVHQLSSAINLRKGMNFSDYLNRFRIRHCQKLVNAGNRKITLRDLPASCGFHNRNTFTIAFKKFTGMTPSEYLKKH